MNQYTHCGCGASPSLCSPSPPTIWIWNPAATQLVKALRTPSGVVPELVQAVIGLGLLLTNLCLGHLCVLGPLARFTVIFLLGHFFSHIPPTGLFLLPNQQVLSKIIQFWMADLEQLTRGMPLQTKVCQFHLYQILSISNTLPSSLAHCSRGFHTAEPRYSVH